MFSIRLSEAKENRIIIYRDSFQNGLKLGVQTRGKLASRLHAIDRTLKSVRRFLPTLDHTHAQVRNARIAL